MKHTYQIIGATCRSCGQKIKNSLEQLAEVVEAVYDESVQTVTVNMKSHLAIHQLQKQLTSDYGDKYQLSMVSQTASLETKPISLKTYWPLILVVLYIFFGTLFGMWLVDNFDWDLGMRLFMGLFFLAFAFFKLLDVPGFAMSYISYDIVANKWLKWGYVYPFVELILGLAYLFNWYPLVTNIMTLIIMIIGLIGVTKAVLSKRKIRCACLGTGFNLPMSTVTIIEDAIMAIMALRMIYDLLAVSWIGLL